MTREPHMQLQLLALLLASLQMVLIGLPGWQVGGLQRSEAEAHCTSCASWSRQICCAGRLHPLGIRPGQHAPVDSPVHQLSRTNTPLPRTVMQGHPEWWKGLGQSCPCLSWEFAGLAATGFATSSLKLISGKVVVGGLGTSGAGLVLEFATAVTH